MTASVWGAVWDGIGVGSARPIWSRSTRIGGCRCRTIRVGTLACAHEIPARVWPSLGGGVIIVGVAVAVAIHNIPEGIAVSVPLYAATGNRRKAFAVSFASGLAEPLGALLAWVVLMPFLSPMTMNLIFAAVAGIMVFISLDGLLPAAREYGENHTALYGLVAGMVIMAASIYMFA